MWIAVTVVAIDTMNELVYFKAQLGEPFLEMLVLFSSFFPAKPALKRQNRHLTEGLGELCL